MKKQDYWRKALENFSKLFSSMSQFIRELSSSELRFLLECAEQATPTNCDYHTFDAAQFVKQTCTMELQTRDFHAAVKQQKSE